MPQDGNRLTLLILAIAALAFTAGIIILLYPTFKPQISSAPIGRVLWKQGKVSSRLAQSSIWFELNKDDKLHEGQRLRTGKNSSIAIKLGHQEHFILPANTEIILSNREEKRKSLIEFKTSEAEAQSSSVERSAGLSPSETREKVPPSIKVVEIVKQIAPSLKELQIIWPKAGETVFFQDNQPIHFFWHGPADGRFEIRILDVETKEHQHLQLGKTFFLRWLPPKNFVNRKLAIQAFDRQNGLESRLTEFFLYSTPTLRLKHPAKHMNMIYASHTQPLKIEVENDPRILDITGELSLGDTKMPLIFVNGQALVPYTHLERMAKQSKSWGLIRLKGYWRATLEGQASAMPLEEYWVGQIDLTPKKPWWQVSSEKNILFNCDEEKKEWVCKNPVQLKIDKGLSFNETEILLSSGQTLSPHLDENKIMTFCPPLPLGDLQYKVRLKSDSATIKYESDWIQVKSIIEDTPKIINANTINSGVNEYYTFVTTNSCREIPLSYRWIDEQNNTIHQFSDFSPNAHIVLTQKPSAVELAYADLSGRQLSEAMRVGLSSKSLTCESNSSVATKGLEWTLKDNGKVYIQAKDVRPWTLLTWKASQSFDKFEVQIAADDTFTNIIAQETTSQKSLQLILQPEWKKIYWRVRGVSTTEGPTTWSSSKEIAIYSLRNNKQEANPRISKPQE